MADNEVEIQEDGTSVEGELPTRSGATYDPDLVSNELRDMLPAGTRIENYEITGPLGAGGFGKVYLARDTTLESRVALKEYFPLGRAERVGNTVRPMAGSTEQFERGQKQFLREAQVIAELEHSSIVDIYTICKANGTHYMVMEYLGQRTLTRYLAELGGRLTQAQMLEIMMPVLDAAETVHETGRVHRDISPDNIMVAPDGTPVLLDFGTVREALLQPETGQRSRAVSKSQAIVNDGFSALEIYSSARTNLQPASDIYSLSAVNYMLITGITPAPSTDRLQDDEEPGVLLEDGSLRSLFHMELKGHFDRHVLVAIERGLALRARDRPETVRAWRIMLEDRSEPIEPRKPAKGVPVGPLAAAAGLVVVLGVGAWSLLTPGFDTTVDGVDETETSVPVDQALVSRLLQEGQRDLSIAATILQEAVKRGQNEAQAQPAVVVAQELLSAVSATDQAIQKAASDRDVALLRTKRGEAQVLLPRARAAATEIDLLVNEAVRERGREQERLAQELQARLQTVFSQGNAVAESAATIADEAREQARGLADAELLLSRLEQTRSQLADALNTLQIATEKLDESAAQAALEQIGLFRAQIDEVAQDIAALAQAQARDVDARLAAGETQIEQIINALNGINETAREMAQGVEGQEDNLATVLEALANALQARDSMRQARADLDEGAGQAALGLAVNARAQAEAARDAIIEARDQLDGTLVAQRLTQGRSLLATLRDERQTALNQGQGIAAATEPLARIEEAFGTAQALEASFDALDGGRDLVAADALLARAEEQSRIVKAALTEITSLRDGRDSQLAQIAGRIEAGRIALEDLSSSANESHGDNKALADELRVLNEQVASIARVLEAAEQAVQNQDQSLAATEIARAEGLLPQARAASAALDQSAMDREAALQAASDEAARLLREGEEAFAALREDLGNNEALAGPLGEAQSAVAALSASVQALREQFSTGDLTQTRTALETVVERRTELRDAILAARTQAERLTRDTLVAVISEIETLLASMRNEITRIRQVGEGLLGVDAQLAQVSVVSGEIETIATALQPLRNGVNSDAAQALLARVEEQNTALRSAVEAIERAFGARNVSIQQIVEDTRRRLQAATQRRDSIPTAAQGNDALEAALSAMQRYFEAIETAASTGNTNALEEAVASFDRSEIQFNDAVQQLRQQDLARNVAEAADAVRNTLAQLVSLRDGAATEAGISGVASEPLQRIEAALAQARTDVEGLDTAVQANDLPAVQRLRETIQQRLDEANTALLDLRRAVEEAERGAISINVSELDQLQRTGVYRGLFRLGFLPNQEIDERFLAFGQESAPIRAAIVRFNEARGRNAGESLLLSDLSEIVAAAGGVTDWEQERTIWLMGAVSERSLWDYGINRRLGLLDFRDVPTRTQGAPQKDRSAVARFQQEIGAPATGFFANEDQLMQLISRPINLNVSTQAQVTNRQWYYASDAKKCHMWTYASRIEGPYLRPDTPILLLAKARGEDTPDLQVILGPANAFAPGDLTLTSDKGVRTVVSRDVGAVTVGSSNGQVNRDPLIMLKRDKSVTLLGPSVYGGTLSITYSALGFGKAFALMEQQCSFEIGFWTE